MPDRREPRSIIEAAEQAAAAGNYGSAETLLREAALVQEAGLGPLHPELANTLNNLGVVCEIISKPADAERCFRRALTIATTVLDPDHPFVTTSRKNLSDFCEARGKPVELPTPAVTSRPDPPATPSPDQPRESRLHTEIEDPEVASRRLFSRLALGALGPIAMLMVILAAGLPRLNSSRQPEPLPTIGTHSSQDIPAPAPALVPVEPITSASTVARPTVLKASLCADLDDWLCDPADRPVPPGPLFFYTQVTSIRATTLRHRWYRDNRLSHSVELRVEASPTVGHRTFSHYSMSSESAGNWRVELRSEDGALLHEESFTVR